MCSVEDEIILCTLDWLQHNYFRYRFYTERDIVWTIQSCAAKLVEERQLNFKVFNDYPITFNDKRARVDLAFVDESNLIVFALELKYEPSHRREDILQTKFPVVFWNEVKKDIERIHYFVESGQVQAAYSLLIDEGGYFRKRPPAERSNWIDWNNEGINQSPVSILLSKAKKTGTICSGRV